MNNKYPSKEEVVEALQKEGFVKLNHPSQFSAAKEAWVHGTEIVEIEVLDIEGCCSVGWTNSMSFIVGFKGVLDWLQNKGTNT